MYLEIVGCPINHNPVLISADLCSIICLLMERKEPTYSLSYALIIIKKRVINWVLFGNKKGEVLETRIICEPVD